MRLSVLFLAALAAPLVAAQASEGPVRATTEDGRRILVYADGTWRPDRQPPPPPAPPPAASPPLQARSSALPPPPPAPPKVLESSSGVYSIQYDASRWRRSTAVINQEAEFEYVLPMGAGYAITIYEVTPFELSSMKEIVLEAPRTNLGADVRQVGEEAVKLGAVDGLRIEYEVATPEGVNAVFINTMYSDERGTLQVLTWTSASVVDRFRDELLRFHDGLVIHEAVEP